MLRIKEQKIVMAVTEELNNIKKEKKVPLDYMMKGVSLDDIALIKSLDLKIDSDTNLEELKEFENLQHLEISYDSNKARVLFGYQSYNKDNYNNMLLNMHNQQQDFSAIENLESLNSLIIKGHPTLEKIDVSKLSNLYELQLSNNKFLKEVNGLEELTELSIVKIFGGRSIKTFDFSTFKNNNPSLGECVFDMKMYPEFAKETLDFFNLVDYRNVTDDYNLIKVNWVDVHSNQETSTTINSYQANQMYQKAIEIVEKNTSKSLNDYENLYGLYKWVVTNIKYDYEGLAVEQEHSKSGKSQTYYAKTHTNNIRSTYQALLDNKVVCAGYANLFIFLSKVAGIDSEYVSCNADIDKFEGFSDVSNHAIVKTTIAGNVRYLDPTWDAGRVQEGDNNFKYFLKNKDEIMETHKLTYQESQEKNAPIISEQDKKIMIENYNKVVNKQYSRNNEL